MDIIAAPLFLPPGGLVRSGAGNESFMSTVAHAFTIGKINGGVAPNVFGNSAKSALKTQKRQVVYD